MSSLCDTSRKFGWDQLDRNRKFRYAWWKRESLQVHYDEKDSPATPNRFQVVSSKPDDVGGDKAGDFLYHRDMDDIALASASGCHIRCLVLKGFAEYSTDDVVPRQRGRAISWFKENSCRIQVIHNPASGTLEFHFDSRNVSRRIALRYYFVSCKCGNSENNTSAPRLTR